MARISGSTKPEPFALAVTPHNVSLTDGTDIPPPPRTPSKEPPTPGGGPLTSHPTTPEKIPGAYPSSSSSNKDSEHDTPEKSQIDMDPTILRSATNDSSPPPPPPQQQQILRKPSGVRRLFSMSNLRTSFSGSRTSLALPRASTDYRPSTSVNDRPFTPSMSSTNSGSPVQPKQPYQSSLQRKRSGGGWFKRKSSLLWMNNDGVLDAVDEDREVDDARGAKRFKSAYSMPLLPEISELGGGELSGGGELGFDASLFKRV